MTNLNFVIFMIRQQNLACPATKAIIEFFFSELDEGQKNVCIEYIRAHKKSLSFHHKYIVPHVRLYEIVEWELGETDPAW